jgi:hypothetical protein
MKESKPDPKTKANSAPLIVLSLKNNKLNEFAMRKRADM